MKKRYFTAIFVVLILTLYIFNSSLADEKPISVTLNGVVLNLDNPAISRNGVILLPIKNVLSEFNTTPVWHDELKQITCSYNNMFVKTFIGKKAVYLNGNHVEYDYPVELINDTTYAPIGFFCDFLSLDYQYLDETVQLSQRENSYSSYHGTSLFTEKTLPEYNIIIALPYGWSKLTDGSYGVLNPYETYFFTINKIEQKQPITKYIEHLKHNLLADINSDGKNIVAENVTESELITSDRRFYTLYYSTYESTEKELFQKNESLQDSSSSEDIIAKQHHAHYICIVNENIYDFHFVHNKINQNNQILMDFEYSLSTLKFPPEFYNSMYENYVEFEKFFDLSMEIKSNISSNQEAYDSFLFEGTCKNFEDIELLAEVKKDGESREFIIQLDDEGNFSGPVYTPFGVGKHQVTIYCKYRNNEELKEPIMSFSAVNLSGHDIKYIVPGVKVRSKSLKTEKMLNRIFNEISVERIYASEYNVSKNIFKYLEKNIKINKSYQEETKAPDNSEIIMDKSELTETEANILFVTLMRGSGISSRIVKGRNRDSERIYCECLINGEWRVFDLAGALKNRQLLDSNKILETDKVDSLLPEKKFKVFYSVKTLKYEELFNTIEYLDY